MSKSNVNEELLIYASGIDLAVQMAKANGNAEYVIFPQKEMTELTELIRKKVLGDKYDAKWLLKNTAKRFRSRIEHDDFGNGVTTTVPTVELSEACDLIDEVCK